MTDYKFRDVFLVIKHTQVPAKGEKTHLKDWKKTGKWDVFEEATVTDGLKKRLESEASIIINVNEMKVEKNRFRNEPNGDDKAVYISYMQKYQENIAQFYAKYRPQIIEEMLIQKAEKVAEEENKEIKD